MNASRLPGVNRLKQFWRVSERRQTNLLEKKKKGGEFRLGERKAGPEPWPEPCLRPRVVRQPRAPDILPTV